MIKLLLAVDGSQNALNATHQLVSSLAWYRETPHVDVVTVHLAVPKVGGMEAVISKQMLENYYADEFATMMKACIAALDAAAVPHTDHRRIGPVAENIVAQAVESGSDLICMGTRGMTSLSGAVMGSVATRVLHLARVPVLLTH